MKILIITVLFGPSNSIAAIRTTKLAKYLRKAGHDVTVLTDEGYEEKDPTLANDIRILKKIKRIKNSTGYNCIYHSVYGLYKNSKDSHPDKLLKKDAKKSLESENNCKQKESEIKVFIRDWLFLLENYDWNKQAIKWLKKQSSEFDVVISSYGPFSSHLAALYVKKRSKPIYWVADFRDAIQFQKENSFAGIWARRFTKKVITYADKITAVSSGCFEGIERLEPTKVQIIPNGFDRDDLSNIEFNQRNSSKLTLCYVGSFYKEKRSFKIVFKAIKELIDSNEIEKDKIEIVYAGRDFRVLQEQGDAYDLCEIIKNNGFVSRNHSIQLQLQSDVLLLGSWNETGSTGIVTGKFLEYLMMDKPILCTITGDLPDSLLKQMIKDANIGFCWEEANGVREYNGLKHFIKNRYNIALNRQSDCFESNKDFIQQFEYQQIAQRFSEIFMKRK